MLQRRRSQQRNQRPITTVVARQHRMAPPPLTAQEKMYAEQYTALQPPHHHGNMSHNGINGTLNGGHHHMMPNVPSGYNITPYDLHSDVSIAKMAAQQQAPVHNSVLQPLTQNHLHNHNMHNMPNQGHYYSTYDNC